MARALLVHQAQIQVDGEAGSVVAVTTYPGFMALFVWESGQTLEENLMSGSSFNNGV